MAAQTPYKLNRRNRFLDDWNSRLTADAIQGSDGKKPMLFLDFKYKIKDKDGVERFRDPYIGVNLRTGAKEGRFQFPLTPAEFSVVIQKIRLLANNPSEDLMKLCEKGYTFFGGKRSEKPETKSTCVAGRDDKGIFIGVVVKSAPPVKFYFCPNDFYPVYNGAGETPTLTETASLYALAYAELWHEGMFHIFKNHWMDDAELEQAKLEAKAERDKAFRERTGGGQSGYSGNAQPAASGSGSQTSAAAGATYDDDIPWG